MPISSSAPVEVAVAAVGISHSPVDIHQPEAFSPIRAIILRCGLLYERVIQELILKGERGVANAPLPASRAFATCEDGRLVVSTRSFDGLPPWAVPPPSSPNAREGGAPFLATLFSTPSGGYLGSLLLALQNWIGWEGEAPTVLLAALVYLLRLGRPRGMVDSAWVTSSNWYRLTTVAILTATKMYNEDNRSTYSVNQIFAKAARIPITELRALELDFLYLMDFDLVVEEEEVKEWAEWVMMGSPVFPQHLQNDGQTLVKGTPAGEAIEDPLSMTLQPGKNAGFLFSLGDVGGNSEAGISYNRSALSIFSNGLSNSIEYAKETSPVVDIPRVFTDVPSLRSADARGWGSGEEDTIPPQESRDLPDARAVLLSMMNPACFVPLVMPSVSVEKQPRLFSVVHAPIEPVSPLTLRELSRLGETQGRPLEPRSLTPISPGSFFKRSGTGYPPPRLPSRTSSLVSHPKAAWGSARNPQRSSLPHRHPVAGRPSSGHREGVPLEAPTEAFGPFQLDASGPARGSWESHPADPEVAKPRRTIAKEFSELATRPALMESWRDRHALVKHARQMFTVFSSLVTGKLDILDGAKASNGGPGIVEELMLPGEVRYGASGALEDAAADPTASVAEPSLSRKGGVLPPAEDPTRTKPATTTSAAAAQEPPRGRTSPPCSAVAEPREAAQANMARAERTAVDVCPAFLKASKPSDDPLDPYEWNAQPQGGASSYHPQQIPLAGRSNQGKSDGIGEAGTCQLNEAYDQDDFEGYNYDGEDEEGYYEEGYYDDEDYYDDEEEYMEEADDEVQLCRPPPRIHSPPLL